MGYFLLALRNRLEQVKSAFVKTFTNRGLDPDASEEEAK